MDLMLVLVVLAALAFAWSNGMHDAANAIATSLSTGALTPRIALIMSAVLNTMGALLGASIALLFGTRLISLPTSTGRPDVVLTALLVALSWNLITWWWGMPTSSTQALIGGLAGAGLGAGAGVDWAVVGQAVVVPMLISPLVGFFGAWLVMLVITHYLRDAAHERVLRGFRLAQSVTAATVSVGHGMQDGQKTMGVMMIALGGAQTLSVDGVPLWVRFSVAIALGLGTLAGGWRIVRTMARRLVQITPVTGFAAEGVASLVLYAAGGFFGAPVSTSVTVNSAVIGAGVTSGLKAVRWGTVRSLMVAWLLTPLVTFVAARLILGVLS